MKYLLLLPFLSSCSLLEAANTTPNSMMTDLATEGPKIAADALGGNYIGAAIGAGSLIAGWLGWKGGKHVVTRMKASEPGKII